MTISLNGTTGIQFPDSSLQTAAASPNVLKNRIINGDFRIDQRNAGASVTPTSGQYNLDRFQTILTQASKFTVQQNAASVTPPAGFTNYLGVTSLSAYSITASDYFVVRQNIEGFNTADLDFGKATAKTITISFWVRSSLTGTFGGSIFNSATDRTYVFSYTISAANTWEQKTVTITGDTTGTWLTNNGIGLSVDFTLASGSDFTRSASSWSTSGFAVTGTTSVVGTNGATFYITGVQLEQNTSATPFERRLYNAELANCERYYQIASVGYIGTTTTSAFFGGNINSRVKMRAAPTGTYITSTSIFNFAATSGTFNTLDVNGGGYYKAATGTTTGAAFTDNVSLAAEL